MNNLSYNDRIKMFREVTNEKSKKIVPFKSATIELNARNRVKMAAFNVYTTYKDFLKDDFNIELCRCIKHSLAQEFNEMIMEMAVNMRIQFGIPFGCKQDLVNYYKMSNNVCIYLEITFFLEKINQSISFFPEFKEQ